MCIVSFYWPENQCYFYDKTLLTIHSSSTDDFLLTNLSPDGLFSKNSSVLPDRISEWRKSLHFICCSNTIGYIIPTSIKKKKSKYYYFKKFIEVKNKSLRNYCEISDTGWSLFPCLVMSFPIYKMRCLRWVTYNIFSQYSCRKLLIQIIVNSHCSQKLYIIKSMFELCSQRLLFI